MRLAFFGSPVDAVVPLRALVDAGHDVALVVTQPDRRRSRGSGSDPSPVKAAALELGLAVRTPEKSREVVEEVRALELDLAVVVAFGQLLPVSLLDAVPTGFVNMHFSLLPRWRGAAPVERALLSGDPETGVCLMRIEAGLDTGPVYVCERTPIAPHDTAGALRERLTAMGTRLLLDHLPALPGATPQPQEGEATYAAKLEIDEFRLDASRPAADLDRVVRAGTPRPGAWFVARGQRVKVTRAHVVDGPPGEPGAIDERAVLVTVDGGLALDEVQPAGKRAMASVDWRRGTRGALALDPA